LDSNGDGTTRVTWHVSYQVDPIYAKFLNSILIKPQIEEMIEENLQGLNQYLNPN
jgi:carbon monoxide dehydrogenase subunit G